MDTRISSKTARGQAQAGIAAALAQGLEVIRDLEVVVEMATRQDPALAAAWHTARHIEGQGTSAPTPVKTPVSVVESPVVTPVTPVATAESDPAATTEELAPVPAREEVLRRAS